MKKILLKVFDLFCLLGVPCGMVLYSYFDTVETVTVQSVTMSPVGVIMLVIVMLLVKKYMIDSKMKDIRHILNTHRADYEKAVDPEVKTVLRSKINHRARLVTAYERACILFILGILMLFVTYISAHIGELKSLLGFTILSIAAGTLSKLFAGEVPIDSEPVIPGGEDNE